MTRSKGFLGLRRRGLRLLPLFAALSAVAIGAHVVPVGAAENGGSGGQAAHTSKKKKKKKACPKSASAAKKKKKKKKCPPHSPGAAVASPPTAGGGPSTPPPPPRTAPPLDPTIATSMADSASWLYSGSDPIQTGVDPDDIDEVHVAVLRGMVIDRAGDPLGGVKVAVMDHPELGQTLTRDDGAFDIAVNGGDALTLTYEKSGYLPIERRVDAPWQDYTTVDEVALTKLDSVAGTIQSNGGANQVARSSTTSDYQGSRRITMIFKPGTTAQAVHADNSTDPLPGPWTVRATEYTVGDTGRNAMPAELPPSSGYTFAAELTIDESTAAGGVRTDFNNPVSIYVDNFIHAPVGMDMPSGFHHEEGSGTWSADPDGRVMKMVGNTGGMADLDVTGDDVADTGAALTDLGIDDAERTTLATQFTTGDEFWRVPTTHFSEMDHNSPDGAPPGATPPPPTSPSPTPEPSASCGSIVSCEDQTLRERVPVNGTPFSLYYASDRVPGRVAEDQLDVRVTDNSPPGTLKGIVVQASVAGRLYENFYQAASTSPHLSGIPDIAPNLHWEIPWDGTDVYGRHPQGQVPILIRTTYVYPATRYESPAEAQKSFGTFGTPSSPFPVQGGCVADPMSSHTSSTETTVHDDHRTLGTRASGTVTIGIPPVSLEDSPWCGFAFQRNDRRNVGTWDDRGIDAMGGWSLDVHNAYDPNDNSVHRGDGLVDHAGFQPRIASMVAGNSSSAADLPTPGGRPARGADIDQATDIATAPDGTLYILSFPTSGVGTGGLYRVESDGNIFTVANETQLGLDIVDGSIVVDADENVYVAGDEPGAPARGHVVRVAPGGAVTPIAGNNTWTGTPAANDIGDDGDVSSTGQATQAKLFHPSGLAIGTDGALYIADSGVSGVPVLARVRRVDLATGLITTAAGGAATDGAGDDLGNGEPSTQHSMDGVKSVAFAPDGTMYAAMGNDDTVVKIGMDGNLTRFAGTGTGGSPNEGFPPLSSPLEFPGDLEVGRDGTVYIRTRHTGGAATDLILAVADDRVTTVGGSTFATAIGPGNDGDSALRTGFRGDRGLAITDDGTIYARDHRFIIRKITPRFAGFETDGQVAASEDGSELWVFDTDGRQTKTVDAVTGTTLYTFQYDSAGRLVGVTDRDNRTTTIERGSSGNATAIVAPGGARTELSVNGAGYASQIRDSGGVATNLTYDSGGLMTKLVDRRGAEHTFSYDADGRLTDDDGPAGRSLHFDRTGSIDDTTVTKTTGTGRQTEYRTRFLANGDVEQTTTDPAGGVSTLLRQSTGTTVQTDPDGTVTTREYAADPRLGLSVPLVSKQVRTTPGGRTSTRTFTRAATLSNPADPFSFTTLTENINYDGHSSSTTYTKATRTFLEITAGNRRTTTVLNPQDRPASLTEGTGRTPTTFTYDPNGRLTDEIRGTLHQTNTWDSRDRLASSTDAAGRGDSSYGYNSADDLTSVTDGVGGVSNASYDGEGFLTGVTEPSGKTHAMTVDGYGAVTGYTPPGGAPQQTYSFDAEGLASGWNQGAGHNGTVGRDSAGRLTANNATGDDSTFTYTDNTDRPATADTDRAGTAQDQDLALEWDSTKQTKLTYSGPAGTANGSFTLAYDGRDDLTSSHLVSGSTDVTTTFSYDTDDLRTAADPSSGTAFTFTNAGALGETTRVDDGTMRTDYGYDSLGRQTTVTGTKLPSTTVFGQNHTYDAGNRLATRDTPEGAAGTATHLNYEYDDAGRLTKVKRGAGAGSDSEIYAYDADGNRTSRSTPSTSGTETATYDAQGRLDARGGIDYTFDAAGYLTNRGSDTFNYGPQGRLLSANVGGEAITYAYDGLGRRTARTGNTGTEEYLYGDPEAPWQLSASRDPGGQLTQYFYDPSGRLISIERGGGRYYVFTDKNGSPRLVTDSAGTVQKRIDYDAYGDILLDTNTGFALRVGYAGGLKDTTSGLVMFGLRDYEPASGRWTSRDPILFNGDQKNLYAYVGNDPVDFTDPDGTDWDYSPKGTPPDMKKYPATPPPAPPCPPGPPQRPPPPGPPPPTPKDAPKKKLDCPDCKPITPPKQNNRPNGY